MRIRGGRFLYSFKNPRKALTEETAYLGKSTKGGGFDAGAYGKKGAEFGTIVFLSDQDLTPEQAYACYSDRWVIELAFRLFKSDLDIRTTDAQDDFAVIGEEFVNTIASTVACRIFGAASDAGLLEESSLGDVMDDLSGVWRRSDAPDELPDRDDGRWVHPFEYAMDAMEALGLCAGRKAPEAGYAETAEKPKRPRGRPRKHPLVEEQPKRPRGRPRKNPPAEDAPKRPRGRPRKISRPCIVRHGGNSLFNE